ncbi:MAG TPA: ArsR family transcriptional regulator [Actinomycetes bacterium]|nr:ArsR family transcriptional regulator [Actinomycetes bacterium]
MRVRVDLSAEDLAATHFSISPLFETIEALRTLRDPGRHALHLPWVRWAERELAATPLELPRVWPLLIKPYRQPEFLMPAPRSRLPDLDQELRQLVATTPRQVRATLARTFPRSAPQAAEALATHPRHELRLIAAEIENAFTRLIQPHWERMRTLLDADIVYHARTLADAGAARMFEQLHTGVRWHGDHLEFTDAAGIEGDLQVAAVAPGGLVLEPSVFIWPELYIKRWTTTRTTVRYPARGAGMLWDPVPTATPNAISRLLGPRRAQLLVLLRTPHTTAELARRLHVTPSAISQHLTALRDAGLISSEHLGRQHLHMTSQLGQQLLHRY